MLKVLISRYTVYEHKKNKRGEINLSSYKVLYEGSVLGVWANIS